MSGELTGGGIVECGPSRDKPDHVWLSVVDQHFLAGDNLTRIEAIGLAQMLLKAANEAES